MAALGVPAGLYETSQGQPAFRAIVANYPVCFLRNLRMAGRAPGDVNFVPEEKIAVPLLVQMGDLDTEGPPQDCISRLQVQKDKGAPVETVLYKNATHAWDMGVSFAKLAANGQHVEYRSNPKVTAESVGRALDFLDRHVRVSNQKQ